MLYSQREPGRNGFGGIVIPKGGAQGPKIKGETGQEEGRFPYFVKEALALGFERWFVVLSPQGSPLP
jgi:hypothetical protein